MNKRFALLLSCSVGTLIIVVMALTLVQQEALPVYASPEDLAANAGPDQTVTGPSPAMVQFDGGMSQQSSDCSDVASWKWYNQWGLLRAEEMSPAFEVNFGNNGNAKPGVTRSFRLVVENCDGRTDEDWMMVTLGEASDHNPAVSAAFTGTDVIYEYPSSGNMQVITTGKVTDDQGNSRWYLSSSGRGSQFASVVCDDMSDSGDLSHLQGTHWQSSFRGGSEGCVGPADSGRASLIIVPRSSVFEVYLMVGPDSGSPQDALAATLTLPDNQVPGDMSVIHVSTHFEYYTYE